MIFVEQIAYGVDPRNAAAGPVLLGRSPGVGAEVVVEIQRFCDDWGQPPALGLQLPAVLSLPLQGVMQSLRGRLYAVIATGVGTDPFFHAAILDEPGFAELGYNPFVLQRAGFFLDHWPAKTVLQRRQVPTEDLPAAVSPPPEQRDVGVVDEAVLQLLGKDRLLLPLELAIPSSDRLLSLIITALPRERKRELRFASFAPHEVGSLQLAGVATPGSNDSGWRRLLLSLPNPPLEPAATQHVERVRGLLAAGDLKQLAAGGRTAGGHAAPPAERQPAPLDLDKLEPRAAPAAPVAKPRPAPPAARAAGPVRGSPGPGLPPAAQATAARARIAPAGGLQSSRPSPRPTRSRLVRQQVRVREAGRQRVSPGLSLLIVGAAALAAGGWFLTQGSPEGGFGWAGLLNWQGRHAGTPTTSLFDVVDIGRIYDDQIRQVTRSGLVAEIQRRDRGEALTALQQEAAGPLRQQVEAFLQLGNEGIQQGSRPDREIDRLAALGKQGEVLNLELCRLDLAWHSLAKQVDWRDLSRLSDSGVQARHDSLGRAAAAALAEASVQVGSVGLGPRLAAVGTQVEGMRALLSLYLADRWSPEWEDRLYAAAERVSPSASPATRAFRNSAFALVRLKRAERSAGNLDLPYAGAFSEAAWPATAVQDILPSLRRQAGKFGGEEAPALLAGILELYASLEQPAVLVAAARRDPQVLKRIEQNPAYRFDPQPYAGYLERIRYQALMDLLDGGADPQDVPDAYFEEGNRAAVLAFRKARGEIAAPGAWQDLVGPDGPAFLRRWAEKEGQQATAILEQRRAVFAAAWERALGSARELAAVAAAGRDWTRSWHALRQELDMLEELGTTELGAAWSEDPRRSRLVELAADLDRSRPLPLEAATVRLAAAVSAEPLTVVLELDTGDGTPILTSPPFLAGPAAPAGSGWVGTVDLDWPLRADAATAFRARVLTADERRELVQVTWPALAEEAGPGVMARPREAPAGSVRFRLGAAWWTGLDLPAWIAAAAPGD